MQKLTKKDNNVIISHVRKDHLPNDKVHVPLLKVYGAMHYSAIICIYPSVKQNMLINQVKYA